MEVGRTTQMECAPEAIDTGDGPRRRGLRRQRGCLAAGFEHRFRPTSDGTLQRISTRAHCLPAAEILCDPGEPGVREAREQVESAGADGI